MGKHRGVAQGVSDIKLHLFGECVALMYRPLSWHEYMQFNKAPGTGFARAEGVEVNSLSTVTFQNGKHQCMLVVR